jgi:L-rhamnose-H+ transport protein
VAEHFSLGMATIFVSGALNGTFAFPMKYARRWSWENIRLVFALIAFAALPWLLAAGFVPHLGDVTSRCMTGVTLVVHCGCSLYPMD